MIKVDGAKIQEIKDHFNDLSEQAIANLKMDKGEDEVSEEDMDAIRSQHKFHAASYIDYILSLSPKKLYHSGSGINTTTSGWREGYTKPTLASRVKARREKNKRQRQARKSK